MTPLGGEPIGTRRSGFRIPAGAASVTRIAAVMGELAAASSLSDIVTVVASHVRDAVDASVSTLLLRDGDLLTMLGQSGVASEKAARWATFAVTDENPASEAVRTARPVVVTNPAEVLARYPHMAPDTPQSRSVVDLPLRAAGDVLGVIGLTFEDNWAPGATELAFLMTFADACAAAIRRVQATEAAAVSAARLQFLARASAELASSLDYEATLSNVAQLTVPTLADWCAVDLLVDDQLRTLAVAHADPDKVAWARRLRDRYPIDMAADAGAPRVVRTGVGELTRDISEDMVVASARDAEHLELLRELTMKSAIIVPLVARDSTLGTVTLIRAQGAPHFDASDLTVAEDLGRRAGVAIDNARLYEQTANVALELQRAVLPESLDQLTGWHIDGYYRPDGNARVGGDFYDAVRLSDGRLAVFIGDVMGHGVQAAAAMAHMRASVRALLTVDPHPQAVLGNLNKYFADLTITSLVSLIYAVIDARGTVRLTNAGSCPPLHISSTGQCHYLPPAGRPPLGTGSFTTPMTEHFLAAGDALLLYTDGLIERHDESLTEGFRRLKHAAVETHGLAADTVLPLIVRAMSGAQATDDIAALSVRRMS